MKRFLALLGALLLVLTPVEAGNKALLGVGKPPGGGGGGSALLTPAGNTTGTGATVVNTFSALTFAGVSPGSTRYAVVTACAFYTDVVSATINDGSGAAAMNLLVKITATAAGAAHTCAIFQAAAASTSGTTFDFVVTIGAGISSGINVTWEILNTSTPTPTSTRSVDGSLSGVVGPTNFVVPASGVGIGSVQNLSAGGVGTWTNATSDELAAVFSGWTLDMGRVTGTGTVAVNYAANAGAMLIGATWSP